jgi:hypothetical protein
MEAEGVAEAAITTDDVPNEEVPNAEKPSTPPLPPVPTMGEASVWLTQLKPAAVLALIKEPLYGSSVNRAFDGFRADAKGYANPLVRSRLAQAAIKDPKLAAKLQELAEAQPKPVIIKTAPKAEAAPIPAAPPKPDPLLALRGERDARRRERDEARAALALALSERDTARKTQQFAEAERDEAVKLAKKQAERIARLERQVSNHRRTEAHLVKALEEDKVSPPPAKPARQSHTISAPALSQESAWLVAVRHLLDKSKFDQALALAEDVLKADGDNLDALAIIATAWEGKREPRAALAPTRRLLGLQVSRLALSDAADTLQRVFKLIESPGQAEPDARLFLAALTADNGSAIEAARLTLTKLRGGDAAAYEWLTAYIEARTSLGAILMPPPGALGPDDPLPLTLTPRQPVTARQVVQAIERGSVELVETLRAALIPLTVTDPETSGRLWAALEQAASDDPTKLIPLRRKLRGPIVVDGSNVAWFDQESLVHGKPRFQHLTAMRRTLWSRGFFPVVLYADANLPHLIDDRSALLGMRDRHELTFVDAGTVADEVLLRNAKHLNAPLVTNDRMEDWDPNGEVFKIRYAISLGGEAHLLTDFEYV